MAIVLPFGLTIKWWQIYIGVYLVFWSWTWNWSLKLEFCLLTLILIFKFGGPFGIQIINSKTSPGNYKISSTSHFQFLNNTLKFLILHPHTVQLLSLFLLPPPLQLPLATLPPPPLQPPLPSILTTTPLSALPLLPTTTTTIIIIIFKL